VDVGGGLLDDAGDRLGLIHRRAQQAEHGESTLLDGTGVVGGCGFDERDGLDGVLHGIAPFEVTNENGTAQDETVPQG